MKNKIKMPFTKNGEMKLPYVESYYLHNKNLSAHFDVYLRLYLTNPKKIGDETKVL